jgi:hypothetical protein
MAFLNRRSRFAVFSAQVRAYGGAFRRKVRAKAELAVVRAFPGPSTCCGHAAEGEPCTCEDVTITLMFRVGPLVKGGKPWRKTIHGEVTLVGGKFDVLEFSWPQEFSDSVRALIGRDFSRLHDVEADIEAAVARKTAV